MGKVHVMGDASPGQKERFSRAWVIAAASAADYTYSIVLDDNRGVDMTVSSDSHAIDFQLKATSRPRVISGCLIHDLDVRTYDLLRSKNRSAGTALSLVVVGGDTSSWHDMDDSKTTLACAAYYLPLMGMPESANKQTVRLRVPLSNLLTPGAMRDLMEKEAARWST